MGRLANVRHERFARQYLELGNGRRAYQAAGYSARLDAPRQCAPIDACASRLLKQAKVKARIEELRSMASKRHDVTEDSLIEELEQARTLALENKQTGPAVQATMGKARITGHVVDRKEVGQPGDFERMTADELRAYIRQHTGQTDSTPQAQALLVTSDGLNSAGTQCSEGAGLSDAHHTPLPTHKPPDTTQ